MHVAGQPKFTRANLHAYQVKAAEHCLEHPQSMLWLDLGLGKTVVSLTNIVDRLDRLEAYAVLIVAPLRVCQTVWAQEAKEWAHANHLTFSLIHGTPVQRHRAMRIKADVYMVNYENIKWLVDELVAAYLSRGQYLPFNMVVFDEISKMKDASSKRHKAMRKLLPYIPLRIGLTGEPASNGYKDLHGQYLAVDSGARLGLNKTDFTKEFFTGTGYMGYDLTPKAGSEELIKQRISDITLQMSNDDYLDLPPFVFNDLVVHMAPAARKQYEELEREMFTTLDSGTNVEVFNAAALTNKCLQAANGALYIDDTKRWGVMHDAKLDALEDVMEESAGKPVLLLYEFKHDLARIQKKFPYAKSFSGPMTVDQIGDLIKDWEAGRIPLLCGHPASMGHGLNLQHGGNTIVWFGLNWSLDLYNQANGRLRRQGQTKPVIVHRILAYNTLDYAVAEALANKSVTQTELKSTINSYRVGKQGSMVA